MSVQAKFITKLMRKGKKEKSEQFLVKALKKVEDLIKEKNKSFIKGEALPINRASTSGVTKVDAPRMKLKSKPIDTNTENGNLSKHSESIKPLLVAIAPRLNLAQPHPKGELSELSDQRIQRQALTGPSGKSSTSAYGTGLTMLAKKAGPSMINLKNSSADQQSNLNSIFDQIINYAKPLVRLKKVRIAGTTHQKPIALTKKQAETDAIKRIITNANKRSEKSITLKLAKEFEEIYFNVVSNKTLTEIRDLHKLAEVNKANLTLKS